MFTLFAVELVLEDGTNAKLERAMKGVYLTKRDIRISENKTWSATVLHPITLDDVMSFHNNKKQ